MSINDDVREPIMLTEKQQHWNIQMDPIYKISLLIMYY